MFATSIHRFQLVGFFLLIVSDLFQLSSTEPKLNRGLSFVIVVHFVVLTDGNSPIYYNKRAFQQWLHSSWGDISG